jgi:hypothetical protein
LCWFLESEKFWSWVTPCQINRWKVAAEFFILMRLGLFIGWYDLSKNAKYCFEDADDCGTQVITDLVVVSVYSEKCISKANRHIFIWMRQPKCPSNPKPISLCVVSNLYVHVLKKQILQSTQKFVPETFLLLAKETHNGMLRYQCSYNTHIIRKVRAIAVCIEQQNNMLCPLLEGGRITLILSCVWVTIDRVWIWDSIYWPPIHTTRNYKQLWQPHWFTHSKDH